jgi:hypothetical protein
MFVAGIGQSGNSSPGLAGSEMRMTMPSSPASRTFRLICSRSQPSVVDNGTVPSGALTDASAPAMFNAIESLSPPKRRS